jgi:flagellar protein FlaF
MTVATHAQDLYGHARSLKTPRDLEYALFVRVTGRLRRALGRTGPDAEPERIAALHDNRRLWSTLSFDLAHPANALPQDLRARLLSLANFALRTGDRMLAGRLATAEGIPVLVEINTIVMRGLEPGRGGGALR